MISELTLTDLPQRGRIPLSVIQVKEQDVWLAPPPDLTILNSYSTLIVDRWISRYQNHCSAPNCSSTSAKWNRTNSL